MRIGLFCPLVSPASNTEYLHVLGPLAEECGFHTLWLAEHVVLFDEYESSYPYSVDGRIPAGGEHGLLEPFSALGFLAAITERIRLGTGICLVPQRNPVYTAKEVTNIDWLSGGRFDFGIGVGWLAEEFRAVDAAFEQRGSRCRAYLEVMKSLWCDEVSQCKNDFYSLPACRQYPKPIQQPHPPIHVGGESEAALRRVADIGQGWYGFNLEPEEVPAKLTRLDELLAERGRSRREIQISIGPYMRGCDLDKLKRYRDAGVDEVIVTAFALEAQGLRPLLEPISQSLVELAGSL